jgi:hypothetical protein
MKRLEANLAASRKRMALLADKRAAAKAALDAAQAQRQKHLCEGDLDDGKLGEKLQSKVDTASSVLAGLDDAIGALQAQIEVAERELNAEREREERRLAAEKLSRQISDIEGAVPNFLQAARALVDSLMQVGGWHFEAGQMAAFIRGVTGQVETAAGFVTQELLATTERVKTGDAPIPREPEPEPVAVIEPAPPTQTVFMLRSAKYRDHAGKVRHAIQFEDCEMPVQCAQRALRCSAAVSLADPRRRELHGAKGGRHVDPNAVDIVDLDDEAATRPPHIDPIMASDPILRAANFCEIDRSADSRVLKIAVPRL